MMKKPMRFWRLILVIVAAFLYSCSNEPEYADPEAHERTLELREQYVPKLIGTWHIERISEKQRFFEQLTFNADGTLTGKRKWQMRQLVTIDGQQRYTDWKGVEDLEGTFTGIWALSWNRDQQGVGSNHLLLWANFDSESSAYVAYSNNEYFDTVDDTTLRFKSNINGGKVTTYERGEAEPSF